MLGKIEIERKEQNSKDQIEKGKDQGIHTELVENSSNLVKNRKIQNPQQKYYQNELLTNQQDEPSIIIISEKLPTKSQESLEKTLLKCKGILDFTFFLS